MVTQARRSGRVRKPKKYSNDAFEGLDILNSGSSSPVQELEPIDDSSEDEDFVEDAAKKARDDEEEEDEEEGKGYEEEQGDEEDEEDQPRNEDEARDSEIEILSDGNVADKTPKPSKRASRRKRRRTKGIPNPEDSFHSRGLPPSRNFTRKQATNFLVGTDPRDVSQLLRSRSKWAEDITLPHKRPDKQGIGGMSYPVGYTKEKRLSEITNDWKWYNDSGGREAMALAQDKISIDMDSALEYYCRSPLSHKILLGPIKNQQIHDLSLRESLSLEHVWEVDSRSTEGNRSGKVALEKRNGWILNIGSRIRCMDWAPNQERNKQYLAIAASKKAPLGYPEHTPFKPSQPYAASIQIWAFASSTEHDYDLMKMTQTPYLVHVICTEWGSVQQIQWCPAARSSTVSDQQLDSIGLLAGIWSDGYLRILDIRINRSNCDPAQVHVKYQGSAFASKPPDSVCACLAWISTTSIAAGCANGRVAIWNIATSILEAKCDVTQHNSTDPSQSQKAAGDPPNAIPYFYHPLHSSYILSICSAYPLYPHFLFTTSIDGYTRMTDIRSPHIDSVTTTRNRTASIAISYCPQIQSAMTSEDNDLIRALPLRHFYQSHYLARTGGTVLSLGAGKAHATLLVGDADGIALITNPMRKMMGTRQLGQWQQTWFRHEWVPTKKRPLPEMPPEYESDGMDIDGELGSSNTEPEFDVREGVSRITEGYKMESIQMGKHDKKGKSGLVYSTIFEDESGVTCVVWNPNVKCGGWAAAGMGSGLVRVEDLAI